MSVQEIEDERHRASHTYTDSNTHTHTHIHPASNVQRSMLLYLQDIYANRCVRVLLKHVYNLSEPQDIICSKVFFLTIQRTDTVSHECIPIQWQNMHFAEGVFRPQPYSIRTFKHSNTPANWKNLNGCEGTRLNAAHSTLYALNIILAFQC